MKPFSLVDLLFPSRCAVCDRSGKNLCNDCRRGIWLEPSEFSLAGLQVFTVTKYSDEVSKILVALKDKGQSALVADLSEMLQVLLRELPLQDSRICLVPAPSRSENFAKRGFHPMLLLARRISDHHQNLSVLNCLVFSRPVQDQVGLSVQERITNLSRSMRLNQKVEGKICYLLDDVVTTGATAQEATRALRIGGAIVAGVLALSYSKG